MAASMRVVHSSMPPSRWLLETKARETRRRGSHQITQPEAPSCPKLSGEARPESAERSLSMKPIPQASTRWIEFGPVAEKGLDTRLIGGHGGHGGGGMDAPGAVGIEEQDVAQRIGQGCHRAIGGMGGLRAVGRVVMRPIGAVSEHIGDLGDAAELAVRRGHEGIGQAARFQHAGADKLGNGIPVTVTAISAARPIPVSL